MTKERYKQLVKTCGKIFPYRILKLSDNEEIKSTLLEPSELRAIIERYSELSIGKDALKERLFDALDNINSQSELVEFSVCASDGFIKALADGTAGEIDQMYPECLEGYDREAFGLIFAMRLSLDGEAVMKKRKIPVEYWEKLHNHTLKRAVRNYFLKEKLKFSDYQWDANFFGCGIFSIGRFLYIPYRWEDNPYVYRSKSGDTLALWEGGIKVRRDGQLDGVNGIYDENAVKTVWEENGNTIRANRVNPEGYIESKTVTLDKSEWNNILKPGDYIIALHIPDGEGYDPGHLHESSAMAVAFFEKYYPEYEFKTFQSESWLFDPKISELLGPDRRISRVKREFYCYPTPAGDRMTIEEVFNTHSDKLDTYPTETTLQRLMLEELKKGQRFHVTGAFLTFDRVKGIRGNIL